MTAAPGAVLHLILARGGSKGVPRKNVLPVGGTPMIGRAIAAARGCARGGRIVVSTEDTEIAAVAHAHGAAVPFMRPANLAGDAVPALPVIRHALGWLADNEGFRPELLSLLQANSPFTRAADIDRAIRLLEEDDLDVVYTVAEIAHPPQWAQRLGADGVPSCLLESGRAPVASSRQQMPTSYRPTGNVSVMRVDFLHRSVDDPPSFFLPRAGQRTKAIVVDPVSALDVDSFLDLALAHVVAEHHLDRDGPQAILGALEAVPAR
jgi:N-acylneuraminate cytidylyltransferase